MVNPSQRPKLPGLSKGGSIRLFENPILEALTHVHPIVPLVTWGTPTSVSAPPALAGSKG